VFIPNHQWLTGSAWGYVQEKPAGLKAKYTIMNQHLRLFQQQGLSGSIYTQPFDVEGEQNGLMTYDREVVKIPFVSLRAIHAALNPDMGTIPAVTAKDADLTEPGILYSNILEQYISGKREPAFLKQMAMMASQAGDKPGAALAGADYVASLKAPLSEEDISSVAQFTTSSKDVGFELMRKHAEDFKKVLGERKYTTSMMNMIFKGTMEPMMQQKASWEEIGKAVSGFGPAGEEILLRARTVDYYNTQNWKEYVPVATAYLEKYGANISDQEKAMFQEAVEKNQ
jgi:hypothetical protein